MHAGEGGPQKNTDQRGWMCEQTQEKPYSIGMRNWAVSGGCSFPGLTSVRNQLGLKILS